MNEMRCMSFTSKGTSEVLVAGMQDKMFVVDLVKGEVTKQVRPSVPPSCQPRLDLDLTKTGSRSTLGTTICS